MEGRLAVLFRVAEALGENGDIADFDSRKRFQKAIYFGQAAGIDLGYRYGWYIKGPYSTDLTRDYYAMSEALSSGERVPDDRVLIEAVGAKLEQIKRVFNVPKDVELTQGDWMELLASWHYLRMVNSRDDRKAKSIMEQDKEHLVPYIEQANKCLIASGLM